MLEVAIRSMGRGRRQRPEFLGLVFAEVFSVPGIQKAWLTDPEGTPLYPVDDRRPLLAPASFSGARWTAEGLLVGCRVDIGACLFDSQGCRRPDDAVSQPSYLFLLLDRSELDLEVARDLRLRLVVQLVGTVAAAGTFLLLWARARTRRLHTALVVSQERARRHQEWATLGAGLAHETKNPLAVVRGIAQRLTAAEAGRPESAGQLQQIVDEVDRVVARINEFLHYSRPAEPRLENVDLHELAEELARLVEPDLAGCDGCLQADGAHGRIRADRGMLRQILLNLLVNAARAIRPDGRVRMASQVEGDGTVTLEVRDDGRGIPAEDLQRVFEPYYSRAATGTGLGLAIVRRLAEVHGWSVHIESEVGEGTTVRIRGMERASG